MTVLPQRDEGVAMLRQMVADCLARELEEVRAESRLISDLGADSLDIVDLIFTMEKRFDVRLREDDLPVVSRLETAGPDGGEFLSAEAVARLVPWLPDLGVQTDRTRVRPTEVLPLITVEALWRLLEHKRSSPP
jgi:acyl carrier protein